MNSPDGEHGSSEPQTNDDALPDPVVAYTANGNLEAHSVVTWLQSHGVRSYAVEDHSGVSLFAFGTISQFHKPQVFVGEKDLQKAGVLLRQFEDQRNRRRDELNDAPPIVSECEECGSLSEFPANQDGTTQDCPQCGAYIDVGGFEWPDDFDFGEAESDDPLPITAEDALEAASKLDKQGDWNDAIAAYQEVAEQWPEHAKYASNSIAEVQRKIDAAK